MSRHRNVRNLTQDDYYDDDYDDDYYDEEDDYYDNTYVAPKKQPQGTSKPAATAGAKGTTTAAAPKKTLTFNTKPVTTATTKTATTTTTTTSTPGVMKPRPGKPATKAPTKTTTTTAKTTPPSTSGVTKPPPGWGAPSTPTTTTTTSGLGKSNSVATKNSPTPPSTVTKSSLDATPPPTTTPSKTQSPTRPSSNNASQDPKEPQSQQSQHQQQPYKPKPLPPSLQNKPTTSQLSMVVLGHVDAGKSTLMGQLLIQTGQVTKRQAKGGQLAWLLDENESERERGVTMEIGTKSVSTNNHHIIVLDAPGHADFIPIMITGAANADTAVLVVDAVTGEFESGFLGGGQTKEHILLAKGLGVSQVIVAINKLDVEGWKQDRYNSVAQQVTDYLIQQRFKPARIQCIPVSGLTGENVKSQTEPLLRSWYQGPTLLQAMDRFKPANRQLDKPLRFIITDMFAEGKGVIARGRVAQGFVQVGDKVKVLPLGDPAVISKLEHLNSDAADRGPVGIAGDTVELVLGNIDPLRVAVGNIVVDPTHLPPIANHAKARLLIMDDLTVPIIRGAQVLFHMHSLDLPAAVTKLVALLKPDGTVLKERPRALTSGVSALVELQMSDNTKIVLDRFQECRALGRFVLRRGGDTIAVGVIEEILR